MSLVLVLQADGLFTLLVTQSECRLGFQFGCFFFSSLMLSYQVLIVCFIGSYCFSAEKLEGGVLCECECPFEILVSQI